MTEYALHQGLETEPVFVWWVPYTLNRTEIIIKAANKRYYKCTHKFGIELLKIFQQAFALDQKNNNTLWADALKKEVENVHIAFEVLADGDNLLVGYQQIDCHIVFDIKTGSLKRKYHLVAGGHKTEPPATLHMPVWYPATQ